MFFVLDKWKISLKTKLFQNNNDNNLSISAKVWKLSDFELALAFADMTRDNLRQIFEFRHKDSLTPEEIGEFRLNVNNNFIKIFTD